MEFPSQEVDFLPTRENLVFVGECGLDESGNHIERPHYIQFLRLGLAFLRQNFEVPTNCQLGLSWFHHIGEPFPVIALACSDETISESIEEVAYKMELAMREFNRAVDWKALVSILNSNAPTA